MPDRPLRETVRRYRTPGENGAVVVEPAWAEVGALVETNQDRRSLTDRYDCQGKRLGDLVRLAREELLHEARQWTASYHDLPSPLEKSFPAAQSNGDASERRSDIGKIFLAGHQPQLFHPGVWLKNFALDRLAQSFQAVAVNLIVDHDAPHTVEVRTPIGSLKELGWTNIPLDGPLPGVPYEDRPIVDWRIFEAFGRRALEAIRPLVPAPMLEHFWPVVLERARATGRLGAAIAQARGLWESRWGNRTLEVPFSRLCQGEAFLWFAAHLVAQLPRFNEHYNIILAEYRQIHRIRNPAQPVPDLRAEDGWLEAPLWIWTQQTPVRRALYVRQTGREAILSDQSGFEVRLAIRPDGDLGQAVSMFQELAERGVRIRPKAILTTLWARLALGDLFIHGVGGARYDQITDEVIRRFMGLEPPQFLVLSGTLHLPIDRPPVSQEKWLSVQRQLRELAWNPERFLNCRDNAAQAAETESVPCDDPETLVAEKWRWIRTPATPENARTRFLAIRRINQALQPWVSKVRSDLLAEQVVLQRRLQAEKILQWRDWPFCFYPENVLQDFFSTALRGAG